MRIVLADTSAALGYLAANAELPPEQTRRLELRVEAIDDVLRKAQP